MTGSFTQLHPEDDEKTAFQRQDMGRVSRYLRSTEPIQNEHLHELVSKVIRSIDPDLDVTLKLNGIPGNLMSDKAKSLLAKRQKGELSLSYEKPYTDQTVSQIVQIAKPYYDIPSEKEIQEKTWSTLPPNELLIAKKVDELENQGNKIGANSILYKYPNLVKVRSQIAQLTIIASRQRDMLRMRNPVLDQLIKKFM